MTEITTAPATRSRTELLLDRIGQIACRHSYVLVFLPGWMVLRCTHCGRTTEGFKIAGSNQP